MLRCCLLGRGQKENNAAPLLLSSQLWNKLLCETGSFAHCGNPHYILQSALRLSFTFSQPHLPSQLTCLSFSERAWPTGSATLLVWLLWLIFSLIPWLSKFHAFWFSGTSGYWFLIGCYPPFGCARKWRVSTYTSILAGTTRSSLNFVFYSWMVWVLVWEFELVGSYFSQNIIKRSTNPLVYIGIFWGFQREMTWQPCTFFRDVLGLCFCIQNRLE